MIRELLDVLTAQVADNNSTRLEWIVVWLISIEIVLNIASNPIFAGKRLLSAALVPTVIMFYKKLGNWDGDDVINKNGSRYNLSLIHISEPTRPY